LADQYTDFTLFIKENTISNVNKPISSENIPGSLSAYDLFIFDLDGTLYDQHRLRNIMVAELFFRWITCRVSFRELRIITSFRKMRELNLGYASPRVYEDQFTWSAEALDIPFEEVKKVVEHWMLSYPLKHLRKSRYPGVKSFFGLLREQNKKIAVFSDFPVDKKLAELHLSVDKTYCSTEYHIAQLKPTKKGIELICRDFKCPLEKAVFFGDRMDTDGETARLAGVQFIQVDVKLARRGKFYRRLINQMAPTDDLC
jgi:FMN phosphatase YigB (HAD superfamily)